MKRLLVPLVVFLVIAGALSAGAITWSSGAAQVNGTTISVKQLNATLSAADSSAAFRCLLAQQGAVTGTGQSSTYSSKFAASELSLLVQRAELASEVAKLHLHSTALADLIAKSQLTSGLTGPQGSACTASGSQVVSSLPVSYVQLLTELQRNQDLIAAHLAGASLTPAGVRAFAGAHPGVAKLACVSVILLASKSAATGVIGSLHKGASFSALAKTKSIDPQTASAGGAVGCVFPGQFNASLEKAVGSAQIGAPLGPIQFGSNYVVLEVTSRSAGSSSGEAFALVSSSLNAELALMKRVGASTHIWVNSAYGSWRYASGAYRVISPSGPPNAAILNPTAVTPVGDTYH